MASELDVNRRGHQKTAAFLFGGGFPLRLEREMAAKLRKDTRHLARLIHDCGGYSYTDGGELIVGHPHLGQVRTQIKSRRRDASRALYNLAKAVLELSEKDV